jgi:hypothetical protein
VSSLEDEKVILVFSVIICVTTMTIWLHQSN